MSDEPLSEKRRILIIDDEDDVSHVCAMMLEGSGYFWVRSVNEASKAVSTARNFSPHLILLDSQLGRHTGLDVANDLRAQVDLCNIPIVFLTGSLSQAEAAHRKALGGFPVLCKPIAGRELVESVLRLAA